MMDGGEAHGGRRTQRSVGGIYRSNRTLRARPRCILDLCVCVGVRVHVVTFRCFPMSGRYGYSPVGVMVSPAEQFALVSPPSFDG